MIEEADGKGAPAPHELAESGPAGKLRLRGGPRIDALVRASVARVPADGRFVEVGYDRGAILLRVLARRPDSRAIGVEIQPGAAAMAVPAELAPRLSLRTGDGLDPMATGEAQLAILAGMGGRTIAGILTRDPVRTRSLAALVLCPSHLEADIRPALAALGFGIADEVLATERGRYYEIIVARPSADRAPTDADRDPITAAWGPRLFDARDPLLVPFLEDARRRFHAAFAEDLRSYPGSPKAALGLKLASLEAALARAR